MDKAENSVLTAIATLATRIADETKVEAIFADISSQADLHIGHLLFTVMAFDSENRQVRRVYSNNPTDYPPGGIKTKQSSPWADQVLDQGQPFIGYDSQDIRTNFADSELIEQLGLASVVNIPVRLGGRTLGTMNLLNIANYYSSTHLAIGRILAGLLCAPILVCNAFETDLSD